MNAKVRTNAPKTNPTMLGALEYLPFAVAAPTIPKINASKPITISSSDINGKTIIINNRSIRPKAVMNERMPKTSETIPNAFGINLHHFFSGHIPN